MIVADTGPLIAMATPADPFHTVAVDAFRTIRRAHEEIVLPTSVYAEAMVWPLRHGYAERMERFIDLTPVRLQPLDRAIARAAARLRADHARLRLPDALVLATAGQLGAAVVTTDAGWPDVGIDVRVLRPRPRSGP